MTLRDTITFVTLVGWPLLGFKRGLNSYDYHYLNNKLYRNSENKSHLYSDKIMWGLGSMLVYANPFTIFLLLLKEVYRLEVNLRGLEDEKKTAYYNEVW